MEIIFLGEKSAVAKLDAQLEAGASLDGVDVAQVTAAGEKDKASI